MSAQRTPRNQPRALVDCECETTTYRDGSGVEIHYCAAHDAAPQLLAALREFEQLITRDSDDLGFHLRVVPIAVETVSRVRAVIAKAEGRS